MRQSILTLTVFCFSCMLLLAAGLVQSLDAGAKLSDAPIDYKKMGRRDKFGWMRSLQTHCSPSYCCQDKLRCCSVIYCCKWGSSVTIGSVLRPLQTDRLANREPPHRLVTVHKQSLTLRAQQRNSLIYKYVILLCHLFIKKSYRIFTTIKLIQPCNSLFLFPSTQVSSIFNSSNSSSLLLAS